MKKVFLIILFGIAFAERIFFDLGPNFELVTLAMLLSAAYLGRRQSFWLVFLIMFFTDLILGNTSIFIFTWTGFLIPASISARLFSLEKTVGLKRIAQGTLVGAGSNFFFFVWTNFGVWLLDSWGMYPKNLQGLIQCYINGLPFWKMQLTGTMLFVTTGFVVTEILISLSPVCKKVFFRKGICLEN